MISLAIEAPPTTATHARPYRFTVKQYYCLGDLDILGEDDRVELIEGAILHISPIGEGHVVDSNALNALLVYATQRRAIVSVGNPVILDEESAPQPDFAVLKLAARRRIPKPDDVLLLVEVSHSSLSYDRVEKLSLYATAAIREYWIVDVEHQSVERYTEPDEGAYKQVEQFRRGTHIVSTLEPDLTIDIPVDDIFG